MPEEHEKVYVIVEIYTGKRAVQEAVYIDGEFMVGKQESLNLIAKAWQSRYVPEPYEDLIRLPLGENNA